MSEIAHIMPERWSQDWSGALQPSSVGCMYFKPSDPSGVNMALLRSGKVYSKLEIAHISFLDEDSLTQRWAVDQRGRLKGLSEIMLPLQKSSVRAWSLVLLMPLYDVKFHVLRLFMAA